MRNKKIITMLCFVITIITLIATLASCATPLSKDESINMIKNAIEKAKAEPNQFNTVLYSKEQYSQRLIYQEQADNPDTEKNEHKIKFIQAVKTTTYGAETKVFYEFGYSKSKANKDKDTPVDGYKPYQFVTKTGEKTVATATTLDAFKSNTIDKVYNPLTNTLDSTINICSTMSTSALLDSLSAIKFINILDTNDTDKSFLATKNGVTSTIRFTVKDLDGNIYNNKTVTVVILYDKISRIEFKNSDGSTITTDLVYAPPKMTTPDYDTEF